MATMTTSLPPVAMDSMVCAAVGTVVAAGGGAGARPHNGGALLVLEQASVLSTASSIRITSHVVGLFFGSGSTHLSPVEMHLLTCWMNTSRGVYDCSAFSSWHLQFPVTYKIAAAVIVFKNYLLFFFSKKTKGYLYIHICKRLRQFFLRSR